MPFLTNPKREAFAQAYARGATAGRTTASYRAAGYKGRGRAGSTRAWRLLTDLRVRRRIAEIQHDLAKPQAPFVTRGETMPALPNPKQEAFAQAYVRGDTAGNLCRSYLAAGYRCSVPSAKRSGSELAKVPEVLRRIAELRQEMQATEAEATERATARLAITKEAVLAELARIAFANLLDYGKPRSDGSFEVDLSKLDRDTAAAIQEIIITDVKRAGEAGKPAKRVRVKLAPKRDALVDLGRHFGLFVDRRHAGQGTDDYADLTDEQLAAKIREVVGQLQRIGVDVAAEFGIGDAGRDGPPNGRPH